MQQYFVNGRAPQEGLVTIADKDTAKHMFAVMRLTSGDKVTLVFSDGVKWLAQVADPNQQTLTLVEALADNVEFPVQVTIAMGFPKGDKLDLVTQKATELGAHQIWAYPADWSVVKWDGKKLAKKAEKLEKIALGAAEQSKRNLVPAIQLFEKMADFQAALAGFDHIFIAYEEAAKEGEQSRLAQSLSSLTGGEKLLFIFGPEGGLSPQEVAQFEAAGGQAVGLGPRILRTETAPLYALSAVSFAMELNK